MRKSLQRQKDEIDARNAEGWAMRFSDTKRALEAGKLGEAHSRKIKHHAGRIFSLYLQAVCQSIFSNYPVALQLLEQAQSLCNDETSLQQRAEILNGFGVVYQKIGRYDQSLSALFKAQSILEGSQHTRLIAVVKNNIANIYSDIGEHRIALHYLNEGLARLETVEDLQLKATILHNIGNVHRGEKQLQEAGAFYLESLSLARESGNDTNVANALRNLAEVYRERGDYDQSQRYVAECLSLARTIDYRSAEIDAMITEAEILLQKEKELAALPTLISILKTALDLSRSSEMKRRLFEIHRLLSVAFEKTGDLANALFHAKEFQTIEREVFNQISVKRFQVLELEHQLREREKETLFYRKEAAQLADFVAKQSEQLGKTAMLLAEKSSFVNEVSKQLHKAVALSEAELREQVKEVIKKICNSSNISKDWTLFESQFNQVHQEFTASLLKHAPNLTRMELRICSLLKIGLSSKEIANLLSLSLRSVEDHRYNARRKLNLSKNKSLHAFFSAMPNSP